MKRNTFFKALAGLAITPFAVKATPIEQPLPVKPRKKNIFQIKQVLNRNNDTFLKFTEPTNIKRTDLLKLGNHQIAYVLSATEDTAHVRKVDGGKLNINRGDLVSRFSNAFAR